MARIGRFRHRLTVQQPVTTRTAEGGESRAWTTFATVWAGIEPIKGREATAAGSQVLSEMDTRVVMRWSEHAADIKSSWRFAHQGVYFEIVAPPANPDLRDRTLEFLCKTGANNG